MSSDDTTHLHGPESIASAGLDDFPHLRALMDLLPMGVLLVEGHSAATAVVTASNPALVQRIGVAPEPGTAALALAEPWFRADRHTRVPLAELPVIQALERGQPVRDVELHVCGPGGRWQSVLASAMPMRRNGNVSGAAMFVQDMAACAHGPEEHPQADEDRAQLTAELTSQRDLLNSIIAEAPAGIAVLEGSEHRFVVANPAYQNIARGKGELIGRSVAEVWPEVAGIVLPLLDGVLHTGVPYHASDAPLTLTRDRGPELAWVTFSYLPMRDHAGRVTRILVLVIETTERVLARQRIIELAERLAAERTLLEAVLAQMPAGVTMAEAPSGRVIQWNAQAAHSLGRARFPAADSIADYTQWIGYHRDGRPYAIDDWPLARAFQRGELVNDEEVEIELDDGTRGIVSISAAPVRDRQGRIVAGVAITQNVTERRHIEAALRLGEERYRTLAENAPDVIARFDAQMRHLYANPAAARAAGVPAEQLIGKTNAELGMPPALVASWNEHIQRVFDSGQPQGMEFGFDSPQGLAYYEARLMPERDSTGTVCSVLCITRETTERRRMENELRRREAEVRARAAELQTVLDAVPAAVFITRDSQARYMAGNRVCNELLRLPAGSNVAMNAPPGERPRTYRAMKDGVAIPVEQLPVRVAAERGVEVRDYEYDLVYEDGAVRHMFGNAAPLRDGDGKVQGAVGAFVDITERRRAEEALREADRRKDEFLAILSHELRNPLAPIRNSLYILERTDAGSAQAQQAQAIIGRQVNHLARLVDDLLDLTRITQGKIRLQPECIELGELVRRTVEDHRAAFAASEIALDVLPAAEPIWVRVDVTRMVQVIGNLLQNAVKFTPSRGRVQLGMELDGPAAVLCVRDTGVGIGPEMLGRIFQPFAQDDRTLDRSRGGLGLGLALVKGLVELHGGAIAVTSEGPGLGAAFTVRLPVAPVSSAAPAARAPVVGPVPRRRILLIEDNVDAAETLSMALALMGHEVLIAHDGMAGLAMARAEQPDVVLCDIGLPSMSGYEVARAFCQDPALHGAVLVALTGYALPDDQQRAMAAGFAYHLAKPPSLEALEQVLAAVPRPGPQR